MAERESKKEREKGIVRGFDAEKGRERIGFREEFSSLMKRCLLHSLFKTADL